MAPELTAPLKSANGSRASRRGKTKTFPKKERQGRACSASRWSAIGGRERAEERFYLTRSGPLMEAATVRERSFVNCYAGHYTSLDRRQFLMRMLTTLTSSLFAVMLTCPAAAEEL